MLSENYDPLRALIADDQPDVVEALRLLLKSEGYQTGSASSPAEVLESVRSTDWDLLLLDLNYARDTTSGREGLDLLDKVRAYDSTLPVVVMTAWASVDLAVEAMKKGGGDFVLKPWENGRLLATLRIQIEKGRISRNAAKWSDLISGLENEAAAAKTPAEIISTVCDHLTKALGVDRAAIFTRDHQQSFRLSAAVGQFSDANGVALPPCISDEASPVPAAAGAPAQPGLAEIFVPVGTGDAPIALIAVPSRDYEPDEVRFLEAAATITATAAAEVEVRRFESELLESATAQLGLLPAREPDVEGYELASYWEAAREVGGDYFDILPFENGKVGLCIADVSGKGMPAALLMANLQAAIRLLAGENTAPDTLCREVNRLVYKNIHPGRFITLFYALLDRARGTIEYTNAGHVPPIVAAAGSLRRLRAGGAVLGAFPEWEYERGTITLAEGDRLMLFTDGLVEARSQEDEEFGEERLSQLVLGNPDLSAKQLGNLIGHRIAEFSRHKVHDDLAYLILTKRAEPGARVRSQRVQ